MKIKAFNFLILFLIISEMMAQAQSIEEREFVPIGGIEQWITIDGEDVSKPVVLFLHGGPGSVMSPYSNAVYGDWESEFVLVNWDQRGAGRTFGKNAPSEVTESYWIDHPLSVDQMTSDGIELTEYLTDRLEKEKIVLIGTSWGSILGVEMARKRPDLFYAYIGHSQFVNLSENLRSSYEIVLHQAKENGDEEVSAQLESLGRPPYADARKFGQLLRTIKRYEAANSKPAPETWWKAAPEYDNESDAQNRFNGDDYSFINFAGHEPLGIRPMAAGINFMEDGFTFEIPIYIVQGKEDILTPKEVTKPYFDKIEATEKEFFLLPDAAHGHNQSVVDKQYEILKTRVFD